MASVRDLDLPDLVAGVIEDLRELAAAEGTSLKADLSSRLGELGIAIKSWLIALCVAIVTMVLLGISIAATLSELGGLPWYASLWAVTAIAIAIVVGLVLRARSDASKPLATTTPQIGLEPS